MRLPLCLFVSVMVNLLPVMPRLSYAWELTVNSALVNFRYVYASQAGSDGFFGPFNIDMSSKGSNLASMNGWFQARMLSGTTAVASSTRFAMFPLLRFNKAAYLTGTYRIRPEDRQDSGPSLNPDLEAVFSRGTWTRLWMTVHTPLGTIHYGRRGFQKGCGLQFSSTKMAEDLLDAARRTVEIFELETCSGPLAMGVGAYPWRRGSTQYWNFEDQNAARSAHVLSYIRYAAGDFDAGAGGFYWESGEGPEGRTSTHKRISTPPSAASGTEGWIYFKYFNGRLFFNAEADWYYSTIRYQSSQDGTFNGDPAIPHPGGGSRFAPKYVESWRYMIEMGGLSGPIMLSLLLCHMPGPDRRHGILIDKQPFIQDPERSAYGVFNPYCLLMAKYYRAGVNSEQDMSASDVAAGQLQYMAANNLTVDASVMLARRASHGYGYGYIRPNPDGTGTVDFGHRGDFSAPAPSIPDNDLGWEVNLGVAWKLLENWELYLRTAYWQPGKWFNFACIDKSITNWDVPSSVNNWGTNPDRVIAPIIGIELYVNAKL
ncbi:MAG: hypothetical protein V1792_16220 [Pseudomonadota bacterium]